MLLFLNSCILGFCFGMIYDFFRITRIAIKTCAAIIFIEDILFFAAVTVGSFAFIVLANQGLLRGFLFLGILLGMILYFSTLSIVIINAAAYIIKTIKCVLKFIYKMTLWPILYILKFIANGIQSVYVGMAFKKMLRSAEKYTKEEQEQAIITEFLQN